MILEDAFKTNFSGWRWEEKNSLVGCEEIVLQVFEESSLFQYPLFTLFIIRIPSSSDKAAAQMVEQGSGTTKNGRTVYVLP
jgi:hypothetical protein